MRLTKKNSKITYFGQVIGKIIEVTLDRKTNSMECIFTINSTGKKLIKQGIRSK